MDIVIPAEFMSPIAMTSGSPCDIVCGTLRLRTIGIVPAVPVIPLLSVRDFDRQAEPPVLVLVRELSDNIRELIYSFVRSMALIRQSAIIAIARIP